MGIIASRNLEEQRREEKGIVYFDRGVLEGRNGKKYDRYAIQTHFVQQGEDQAELGVICYIICHLLHYFFHLLLI